MISACLWSLMLLLSVLAVGCSPDSFVTPPGDCANESEFLFVGNATLADLKLGNVPSDDPDLRRPAHFWVTQRMLQFDTPPGAPGIPPARTLCARWLDGRDDRYLQVRVPDDWRPPK